MSEYGMDFDKFCEDVGCTTKQGREIAGFVLEYLHRASYCEFDYGRGALGSSYFMFGGKAAYHLMGLLAQTAEGWGRDGNDVIEDVSYNWAQGIKDDMTPHIPDFAEWNKLKTERRRKQDETRRELGENLL